jgi:hypothetical protein
MATRSLIGMNLGNGIVKTIYCHWDGYPEGVGVTLVKHYNTPSKVNELLELGDVSSLFENLEDTQAYHRDRGESLDMVGARDVSEGELMEVASDYDADYVYVFNDNFEWDCLNKTGTQIKIVADVA